MSESASELVNIGMTEIQQDFVKLLDSNGGNVSDACRRIGIHRSTFYDWADNSDIFKTECDIVRENAIDWGEALLKKKMQDGDTTAIIFYLKTIGRRRGYIEKYDINLDKEADQATEITDYLKRGQLRVEAMKSDVVSEQ